MCHINLNIDLSLREGQHSLRQKKKEEEEENAIQSIKREGVCCGGWGRARDQIYFMVHIIFYNF